MVNRTLKYISGFFFIVGFTYNNFLVLGLSLFIIGLLFISKWWLQIGKKQIQVKVKSREKASYIGEPVKATYTVENQSKLPFTNVRLIISLHRNIKVKNLPIRRSEGYYHFYELVFSLPPRSKSSQTIIYQFNRRGNYLIGDIKLLITDPFSLNIEGLKVFQLKDINIYPDLHAVPTFPQQNLLLRTDGRRKARIPWLEERILPKGSREYLLTDPFYKIDWKQTSRNGQLYTKQYEHSMKQEVWILGNLRTADQYAIWSEEERLEKVLSTIASFAYFFSKNNISYHILFNAKLVKKNELYHLKSNKKNDLNTILYELAKLSSYTTVDFTHLFRIVKSSDSFQPTILVISTYLSKQIEEVIARYKKQKYQVIWINPFYEKTEESSHESMDVMANTSS